jgi:hypothetical protein
MQYATLIIALPSIARTGYQCTIYFLLGAYKSTTRRQNLQTHPLSVRFDFAITKYLIVQNTWKLKSCMTKGHKNNLSLGWVEGGGKVLPCTLGINYLFFLCVYQPDAIIVTLFSTPENGIILLDQFPEEENYTGMYGFSRDMRYSFRVAKVEIHDMRLFSRAGNAKGQISLRCWRE